MKVASTDQNGATADEIAPTAAMNSTVVCSVVKCQFGHL